MDNPLNISSKSGIDNVFKEVKNDAKLKLINPNHLKIYHVNIDSNVFCYLSLNEYLKNNIGRYVYSRAKIQEYKDNEEIETLCLDAVKFLRNAENENDKGAGGELGEILLFLFLEQVLHAPKLLSKIELKTSNNQYIYGCDGVHLLADNKNGIDFFQLVLGESKIIGNLKSAVNDAFNSISKFNIDHESDLKLIDTQLLKESFDDKTVKFIKSLVIPSKINIDLNVDKSFGIFLGYSFKLNEAGLDNVEYRIKTKEKLKQDIEDITPHIERKIIENKLQNHSFYFYILPFNDAMRDRADIINKLKGIN